MKQNNIEDCFYREELQKTRHSDVYLIEKVLWSKEDRVHVQRIGMNQRFRIHKNDLMS